MLNAAIWNFLELGLVILIAFYVAFNLGANDVANSMGTSVGSKALTLKQALIVAGILEFTGAVLFGKQVSETLATSVVKPEIFATTPQIFLIGMVSVLIAAGLWLQIATRQGLPVSSSHATVGAIAGFSVVVAGFKAVNWQTIGVISLTWLMTPVLSAAIAALFYSQIKRWILDHPQPFQQLQEWIPWLSSALLAIFGILVLPSVSIPLQNLLTQWGIRLPAQDLPIAIGVLATISLTGISWNALKHPTPATPSSAIQNPLERQFAHFQIISACFVAFAHGSNDVGNTIAPLAAILHIRNTGTVPIGEIAIPLWVLILGGAGIVSGLAIWGKNVITTVGEEIIALAPSAGFCAELATATTVLLASRLGLPVSTSHALVGGVVGVGLVQGLKSVRLETVRSIALAWIVTVPTAAVLAAGILKLLEFLPSVN